MQSLEWSTNHDDLLTSWKKQCSISMWLALASKYYYSSMNNWLTYPGIVFSAITSIGVVGLGCEGPGLYILSVLNLIGGILNTVCKQAQPAEKSQDFYLRAKDYYKIIREIDYLLAIDYKDRPPVNEVMLRIKADLDRIMDQQMQFPLKIIRDYEHKFQPLHEGLYADINNNNNVNDDSTHESQTPHTNPFVFKPFHKNFNKPSLIMMPYQLYMNPNTLSPIPNPNTNRKSVDKLSQIEIDLTQLDKHDFRSS